MHNGSAPKPKAHAAIIIPVHNRRAVTLRCLENLENTCVLEWAGITVVDDGSTDGTEAAIRDKFPEVSVLKGNGDLWWGGAIHMGMEHVYRSGAGFIVWLNDDCLPDPRTLAQLVDHTAATGRIAAGWAATPSGGRYGGSTKTWRGLRPVAVPEPGNVINCDAASGNCVVFPRSVIEAIGLPDAALLPHALLDVDYTLTATERGFGIDLLGSASCRNEDNLQPAASSWLLGDESPMKQWHLFLRPHSTSGYRASFYLKWRHWHFWGLALYIGTYLKLAAICLLRALVPLKFLRALHAKRSSAWQRQSHYPRPADGGSPPAEG